MLLARFLGATEFGKYSSAFALAAVCIVFVDMGTNSLITRELARRPAERSHIARASHTIKLLSGFASWLLLAGLTRVLHLSDEARSITLLTGILVIGQSLTDFFSAVLTGLEEMGWEAALKFIARLCSTGVGLALLFQHQSLTTILTGMAVGSGVGYGLSCLIVRMRLGSFGYSLDIPLMKSLMTHALPLLVSVVFWILYESQDILILNSFGLPQSEIGYFSSAVKILDVLRVYPVLLVGVFFPALSRLFLNDPTEYQRKRRRIYAFLTLSLLALSALTFFAAPQIITTLYRESYAPAIPLLRTLACSLWLSGLNYTSMQLLIATHREKQLLTCALLSCTVNGIAAYLLVPHWGPQGTCLALLISEIVNFGYLRRAARG